MQTTTQGPTYHCACPICGAVIGATRPDQQPEPWQELQHQRVDHINDAHRVHPDYPYPDFKAWEAGMDIWKLASRESLIPFPR